jgi:hypothetical protein
LGAEWKHGAHPNQFPGAGQSRFVPTTTICSMTNYLNFGGTIVSERSRPLLPPSGIL